MNKKCDLSLEQRKDILNHGTNSLDRHIQQYSKKIQNTVLENYGLDGELNTSDELINLTKGKFLKDFFSSLENKFKRTTFYDKKILLNYIKKSLEKYFNGIKESNSEKRTSIEIFNILPNGKGVLDVINKDYGDRMKYYNPDEFLNKFQGYKYLDSIITKQSFIDFQELDNQSGIITIDTFDSGQYILHFNGLDEFQMEIVKELAHNFLGLVKSKITEIEYRYTNPITKLKNMNYFMAHANKKNYSVIAIDLNNFKYINDIYGHKQGDEVLNKFGELLKSCVRENEGEVLHLSGDEFAILINITDNEQHNSKIIEIINRRFIDLINEGMFSIDLRNPESKENELIEISFSTGVYENKNRTQTLEVCYSNADILMYENKGTTGIEHRILKLSKRIKNEKEQMHLIQNLSTQFGGEFILREDGSILIIPKNSKGSLLN